MSERIRAYHAEDAAAVREVHLRAFDGREDEPRLVELLHAVGAASVSLVAVALALVAALGPRRGRVEQPPEPNFAGKKRD